MLIVVLFDFLNIKSVKIYAIAYIFSRTLLLYKLDTLLLKQMNFPVLDITGFFLRIRTQVTALVLCYIPRPSPEYLCGKRNLLYPIRAASFVSIVLYLIYKGAYCLGLNWIVLLNYSNQKFPLQGFFNRLLGTRPSTLYNRNT